MCGRQDYLAQLYLLALGTRCLCVIDASLFITDVTVPGKLALSELVSLSHSLT